MRERLLAIAVAGLAGLAGCSDGAGPARFAAPEAAPDIHVGVRYESVAVREVSLPSYAALEEISVAEGDGRLSGFADSLWADDPARAVTLRLARALAQITHARVAPEPWPFQSEPGATVDVRLESFVAERRGVFVARGMVFVAPADPEAAERSRSFALEVPFDPAGGFPAIASARSRILGDLAVTIARNGLR